jgi:hypothetical protein
MAFLSRVPSRWLLAVAALAPAGCGEARGQANRPTEYQVKAVCLLHFARFIEWPPQAFAGDRAPVVVAVLGQDPFGEDLDRALEGKTVGERPLVVRRFPDMGKLEACHVLFVSRSEEANVAALPEKLKAYNVATVSEIEDFARRGGVFRLYLRDHKLRFEINIDAAKRAGLTLSAKLLQVGDVIRDDK